MLKNWCFWTVVLEKTLESTLDCKIKPVNPKANQPWIFIDRTHAEAKTLILWPPDTKSQLIGKDSDAGKNWRQNNGETENEMVGLHHWLNGPKFKQTLGDSDGQGGLVHGVAKSHTQLSNWTTTWLSGTVHFLVTWSKRKFCSWSFLNWWWWCCVCVCVKWVK